jgi:hypothetical protein
MDPLSDILTTLAVSRAIPLRFVGLFTFDRGVIIGHACRRVLGETASPRNTSTA